MELILGEYSVDEVNLVSKILESKPPLIRRRLADKAGINPVKLKKLLKRVRSNWGFSVQVNYHAIGLRKIVFLLKGKPENIEDRYLSLYATTMEGNLILSYYLPLTHEPHDIVKRYHNHIRYYLIIEGSYEPRPRLLHYYDKGALRINLYSEVEKAFRENKGKPDITANAVIKRFNEVDLRIIMELQKDPLRSMRSIAKALGYTVPRVTNHMRFLTRNNVIESFSLKSLPSIRRHLGRIVFATIIIGKVPKKYPLKRLAKTLSTIPLMGTIMYGNTIIEKQQDKIIEHQDKTIYIPIITFEKTVEYVHEIVELIKEYINVYDVVIAMKKQRFTLPYKQEEYSKYKGFWRI